MVFFQHVFGDFYVFGLFAVRAAVVDVGHDCILRGWLFRLFNRLDRLLDMLVQAILEFLAANMLEHLGQVGGLNVIQGEVNGSVGVEGQLHGYGYHFSHGYSPFMIASYWAFTHNTSPRAVCRANFSGSTPMAMDSSSDFQGGSSRRRPLPASMPAARFSTSIRW